MSSLPQQPITADAGVTGPDAIIDLTETELALVRPRTALAVAEVVVPRPPGEVARGAIDAALKRGLDLAVAVLGLVVTVPLGLVIALAVLLSSPGPVIFRHERLGRDGQPFTCLKFRTMIPDAEQALQRLLASDAELRRHFDAHFKLPQDPRVTRVGHWLRRTSLDELPQFWNVLKGDMSVVGPRPIVEAERAKYGPCQDALFSVRPGLTGLWQVSGRSDIEYDERVDLDVSYIRTRSFWGDVAIIFRTLRVVTSVGRNGAY